MSCESAFETCGCGATIRTESRYASDIAIRLRDWREGHKHWPMETKTVGNISISKPVIPSYDTQTIAAGPLTGLITDTNLEA